MAATVVPVSGREVRLPPSSEIQGKVRPHAVAILAVNTVVTLAPVLLLVVALSKCLYRAKHEVDQGIAAGPGSRRAAKGKLAVALEARKFIQLAVDEIEPEGQLVLAF